MCKIIFGSMGAGKTTYARKLTEELGYELFDFDYYFSNVFEGKVEPLLKFVKEKIDERGELIIDGWFAWDELKENTVEKMEWLGVDWIYVYAPKWLCKERCKGKEEYFGDDVMELSWRRTNDALKVVDDSKVVDGTEFEFNPMFNTEVITDEGAGILDDEEVTPERVEVFVKEIKQEHYQNIKLPFGMETGGYNDCEKSWERINDLVKWEGKSVLDVGCYWGYFCFKAKEAGAKEVTGVDIRKQALETAREIRRLKRSNVAFRYLDIEFNDMEQDYDVILLLNTLHHLRSPFHVLRKIFQFAENVILEVERPHRPDQLDDTIVRMGDPIKLSSGKMGGHLRFSKPMLTRIASENGHFLKKQVVSRRPHRTILLFGRDK